MDYAHLNIFQIQKLDIEDYLFLMREAYIYELSQTEQGREYLENCWRIEQTAPDREGLRKQFKGKEGK